MLPCIIYGQRCVWINCKTHSIFQMISRRVMEFLLLFTKFQGSDLDNTGSCTYTTGFIITNAGTFTSPWNLVSSQQCMWWNLRPQGFDALYSAGMRQKIQVYRQTVAILPTRPPGDTGSDGVSSLDFPSRPTYQQRWTFNKNFIEKQTRADM